MPAPLNPDAYPELREQFIPLAELIIFHEEEELPIEFDSGQEAIHWRFRFYAARKAVARKLEKLAAAKAKLTGANFNERDYTALAKQEEEYQGIYNLLEPLEASLQETKIVLRVRKTRKEFTNNPSIQRHLQRAKEKQEEINKIFKDAGID